MRSLIIVGLLLSASSTLFSGGRSSATIAAAAAAATPLPSPPPSLQWSLHESLLIEDLEKSSATVTCGEQEEAAARARAGQKGGAAGRPLSAAAEAYNAFHKLGLNRPEPSVLVSMRLEGVATIGKGQLGEGKGKGGDGVGRDALVGLLPQGLSSLFGSLGAGTDAKSDNDRGASSSSSSSSSPYLANFEWGMCGGSYKPNWPQPLAPTMGAQSGHNGGTNGTDGDADIGSVYATVYRHQNHIMCSMSPISSCYAGAGASAAASNATAAPLVDVPDVRSHHAKLLRHWGGMVGATNGIGGSVYDVHDRYRRDGGGAAADPNALAAATAYLPEGLATEPLVMGGLGAVAEAYDGLSSWVDSPHYRYAAAFDAMGGGSSSGASSTAGDVETVSAVEKLLIGDMSGLTGGTTSGNRLIAVHKRPLGTQSIADAAGGSGSAAGGSPSAASPSCFHDLSTMERLCTENMLPVMYLWEELVQLGGVGDSAISPSSSSAPIPRRRRLRKDEWGAAQDASNRLAPMSRTAAHYGLPTASSSQSPSRLSVVDVAVPDAIFVLSTAYHAVSLKASVAPRRKKDRVDTAKGSSSAIASDGGSSSDDDELRVSLELTYVLSTPEEVATLKQFVETQRAAELSALSALSGNAADKGGRSVSIGGNALVKASTSSGGDAATSTSTTTTTYTLAIGASSDLLPSKAARRAANNDLLLTTAGTVAERAGQRRAPSCLVDVGTVQHGEVGGDMTVIVDCDSGSAAGSAGPRTAIVESLLLLPTHTITPQIGSMAFGAATANALGATVEVVRLWYDPLSTVANALLRFTIPLPSVSEGNSNSSISSSSSSSRVAATIPFGFPSLRLDQYPPDMNKAYLIPQVVSRVRFEGGVDALPQQQQQNADVFHQVAMASLMDGASASSLSAPPRGDWQYQRCGTISSVTLPLPDPGMVFNVLSLSSAVLALLIGRGVGIVLRRSVV